MDMEEIERPTKKVKKANHPYFQTIFERYDRDNNGYIDLQELQEMIRDSEDVSKKLAEKILNISDTNRDGKISYPEFVTMLHNEKFKSTFGRYMNSYIRLIVPRKRHHRVPTEGLGVGRSFDEVEGTYEDQYACCPPPIAMFLISIIEFACFLIDELDEADSTKRGSGLTARIFIYDPHKRIECWRFLTYMFVHIGYMHLLINLGVQLLLGVPLEMVHKWWRILLVYFAGVIAGSLATSITDPTSYLAGASGGVYAIMTAHIATILMNWSEMSFPGVILFMFLLIIVTDVSTSIYNRYCLDIHDRVGYAAHFAGAIAGLLVGIWILKNFVPSEKEKYLWWFALIVYLLLMGIMIILNITLTDHFLM